jgi:tetratricopeptide (TPR) repeat protein
MRTHRSRSSVVSLNLSGAAVFTVLLIWRTLNCAQAAETVTELRLAQPVQSTLKDGETHSYKIELTSEQTMLYVISGSGVRFAVKKAGVATPFGDVGQKSIGLVEAKKSGTYSFVVSGDNASAGTRQCHLEIIQIDTPSEIEAKVDYFRTVLEQARAAGDLLREAEALSAVAGWHLANRRPTEAIQASDQGLKLLLRSLPSPMWLQHRLRSRLARAYRSLGKTEQALAALRGAILLTSEDPEEREHSRMRANLLVDMGSIEATDGNLTQAKEHLGAAIEEMESMYAKFRWPWIPYALPDYYDPYVDVLMRLFSRTGDVIFERQALESSERVRCRDLLVRIAERVETSQAADPVQLEEASKLGQSLDQKTEEHLRLLTGQYSESQVRASEREISDLLDKRASFESGIRMKHAGVGLPESLSVTEIQKDVVDESTVLLEYFVGDQNSYLWAVTHNAIQGFVLPKRAVIEKATMRFYNLINDRQPQAVQQYEEAARNLGEILLPKPVTALTRGKRLVVVADRALNYVAFEALPEPGGDRTAPFVPLIVGHEVVRLPSVSVLVSIRRTLMHRQVATKAALVFGDPVFERSDIRIVRQAGGANAVGHGGGRYSLQQDIRRAALETDGLVEYGAEEHFQSSKGGLRVKGLGNSESSDHLALPRLPFTRSEAQGIESLGRDSGVRLLLDFDASRTNALNGELARYRIAHFATHAFLNNRHPELLGLAFSLYDEQGEPKNGFLALHDLYNLNLPVELVVLSACHTAVGEEVAGVGMVGLTQGFILAGAKSVVASLWKVDDAATARLMEHFYHGMWVDRLRPSAALRAAQITMWKGNQWAKPRYWAGFNLQGEWQ